MRRGARSLAGRAPRSWKMKEAAEKLDTCRMVHPERGCTVAFGSRYIMPEPVALNRKLARLGGRTPVGTPWFRLVWGWSRLDWIGGAVMDQIRDSAGSPLVDFWGRGLPLIKIQPTTRAPKYRC